MLWLCCGSNEIDDVVSDESVVEAENEEDDEEEAASDDDDDDDEIMFESSMFDNIVIFPSSAAIRIVLHLSCFASGDKEEFEEIEDIGEVIEGGKLFSGISFGLNKFCEFF